MACPMASIEFSDRRDFRKYSVEYHRFRGDLSDRFVSDPNVSSNWARARKFIATRKERLLGKEQKDGFSDSNCTF